MVYRALFVVVVAGCALAQAPLEFEVASIKASPFEGKGGIGVRIDSARLVAEHVSLKDLIEFAFDVEEFQVTGGPTWASSRDLYGKDRYEVIAQPAGAASRAQIQQMVQALLADRFQLKLRRETREFPTFALVVGPGGSKMKANPRQEGVSTAMWRPGRQESTYEANAASMEMLTEAMRSMTGRKVVDRTNLAGTYQFTLCYAADPPPPETTAPSIFTAVQEQLGLKLEPAKTMFDVLVIESASRPSEN